MAKKTAFVIQREDAIRYRETLRWIRNRLARASAASDDMSLKNIINKHGPVIDELIEELGGSFRG